MLNWGNGPYAVDRFGFEENGNRDDQRGHDDGPEVNVEHHVEAMTVPDHAGRAGTTQSRAPRGVLVVEDDSSTRELIRLVLEREGIDTVSVGRGSEALERIGQREFDLVILDLRLPDGDGLDVLSRIREERDVPTIIVSGRVTEGDRILGLRSGADDYIIKPFSPREFIARVEAVLRRSVPPADGSRLEFGELAIDLNSHEVHVRGELVSLTPQEYDLLVELARRPRRACSREELLVWAWGSSSEYQDQATVTEHVRRLRQKLEHDPGRPDRIVTVRGVGYRFEP